MSDERDQNNEELIAELRAALNESDPVPTDVTEFARAAFSWRRIDAELAEIAYDSSTEDALAGVRSTTTARIISFQAGRWTIDVEYDASTQRLIGQVDPAQRVTVEIRFTGVALAEDTDNLGRFRFDGVPSGPMSLVIRVPGDLEVIKTEWTVL